MSKFSKEEKMNAVKRRLEGKESYASIAGSIGADRTTIKTWVLNYEAMGEDAFIRSSNRHYTLEEKNEAVKFYLEGKGSLSATCKKFKIPSAGTLRMWIKEARNERFISAQYLICMTVELSHMQSATATAIHLYMILLKRL